MDQYLEKYYAHSANKKNGQWHKLSDHLVSVAETAAEFLAGQADLQQEAYLAGMLHDLGKYGDLFQKRLNGERTPVIDHSSAGALYALQNQKAVQAALAIQGHHMGLQQGNKNSLEALWNFKVAPNVILSENNINILYDRFKADCLTIPAGNNFCKEMPNTIGKMLDTRFIFSALVDADYLDTERHFACSQAERPARIELQAKKALEILNKYITEEVAKKSQAAEYLQNIRNELLQDCLVKAESTERLFTLTAPTGSGKTLAMLAFALQHAVINRLRRIILVIPYLSIIEQTAKVYKQIFKPEIFGEHYILEHHSLADRGQISQNQELSEQQKLLVENWDAPIIITTSVQMLESLFANRPAACRKLHHIRESVIMFDEVQTLPINLVLPTLAALSYLAGEKHKCSIVFATATQPAFNILSEGLKSFPYEIQRGWQPQEISSNIQKAFEQLDRVNITWWHEPRPWEAIAAKLKEHKQALCVVNTKKHAQELWKLLSNNSNKVYHLSTNLCPAHRKQVLQDVETALKNNDPCILVATQCIEAGVDIDFPIVYRALAPLEAIIQAAGRCNREGKLEKGKVIVFKPKHCAYPDPRYEQATDITLSLINECALKNNYNLKINTPEFIANYYSRVYCINNPNKTGKTENFQEKIKTANFPEIAKIYRLITKDTINIIVPYKPKLETYELLKAQAENRKALTKNWRQKAQFIAIGLYRPKLDDPIRDTLISVEKHGIVSQDWFIYVGDEYDENLGFVPSGFLNLWIS